MEHMIWQPRLKRTPIWLDQLIHHCCEFDPGMQQVKVRAAGCIQQTNSSFVSQEVVNSLVRPSHGKKATKMNPLL